MNLQRQFGISAKAVPLDLTAAAAPQFLFDQLQREGIAVDILVNNAGYGEFGEFSKVSLEEHSGPDSAQRQRAHASDQTLSRPDDRTPFRQDHERGFDRGISARAR